MADLPPRKVCADPPPIPNTYIPDPALDDWKRRQGLATEEVVRIRCTISLRLTIEVDPKTHTMDVPRAADAINILAPALREKGATIIHSDGHSELKLTTT